MNIKIKKLILLCPLIVCVLCACKKDDIWERWAKEEAELAEWIAQNKPGLTLENGIYFEKLTEYAKNIKPETNDYVLVDYERRFLFEDVLELVSYKDWQARGALFPSTFKEGGPELWDSKFWEVMGLDQLRENESAHVYIPSRLLDLQDCKTRVFWIHLRKVIDPDLKAYQEQLMTRYMKGKNVETFPVEDNGREFYVMFHVEDEGKGGPIEGASIKTQTSEQYFLQNNDFRDCFNKKEYTWNKHLEMFRSENQPVRKGGRIIAVMPYRLMYGDKADMDENMQYIAPIHSVLKYEINIDQ